MSLFLLNTMRYFLVALLALFLAACGSALPSVKPYKMDIQQGNVVNSKMLLQLRPGMSKSQVRFIMGSPLVVDSFHQNRWDYFYQLRQGGKIVEQRRVILEFDKEGKLARVRGDVVPAGSQGAEAAATDNANKTIEVAPVKREEEGLLDKFKFWKDDQPQPAAKPNAEKAEKSMWDKFKFWKSDEKPAEPEKLKELPKSETPAITAPAPEANQDAPSGDTPSVLVVPNPNLPETPSVLPEVTAPSSEAAKIEPMPVKPEPINAEPPKLETPAPKQSVPAEPAPAEPVKAPVVEQPAPGIQNEKLIFRLDKTLRPENIRAPAPEAPPVKAPTPKPPPPPPAPEEGEPGYFEKMLERIGF